MFATQASGVGAIGQKFVGWGTGFIDFDLDGWEDIFIANGHAIRYPTGATRLFLGTVDGFQWSNNTGAYTVTITSNGAGVPEPAAWALMSSGFGLAGATLRRRRALAA